MRELVEKAWEVLNDYYPSWCVDNVEVWAKVTSSHTVELICIDWTMNALELKEHQGMWLKYTIDIEDIGIITAEENVFETEWNKNEYERFIQKTVYTRVEMEKDTKNFIEILNGVSDNPMEAVTQFILLYWGGDLDENEIIRRMKTQRSLILEKEIKAAKMVIEHTEYDSQLIHLVLWIVNVPITEPIAEQAKAWLKEKIMFAENVLHEK